MSDNFSHDECDYLDRLKRRNRENGFKNSTEPLKTPISSQERKLRASISMKCDNYINELALAEFCGVLPSTEMQKFGFRSVSTAVEKLKWSMIFDSFR